MCTVSTAGGTIIFGAVGGTFGLASGVVLGSAAGVVPALLTFGLSIPAGAVLGATSGVAIGTTAGGGVGGLAGYGTYKYRIEIKKQCRFYQKKKSLDNVEAAKSKALALTKVVRTKAATLKD